MKITCIVLHGVLLMLLAALVTTPAAAGGGSVYSLMGIGDLQYGLGVRSAGMGYTGTGVLSSQYLNAAAPATWSRITRVRLEVEGLYEGFSSTDGTTSRYLAHTLFHGATMGIPISPEHGFTFTAGFLPYSTVDFDTYTHGTGVTSTDTVGYSFHHTGTGGLGVGKLGLSYMPLGNVAVGGSFDYYFGEIDYTGTLIPASSTVSGGQFSRSTTFRGTGATLGVLVSGLGDSTSVLRPLSIGATVSSRTPLHTSRQAVLGFGATDLASATELDTTGELTGQVVLPLAYTVGIAYVLGERYLVAADMSRQLWAQSAIDGVTPANLRTSTRWGFGIEKLPSRESNALWRERVALRLGASYIATYFKPNGIPVNEWLVTGGISMPISRESRLNLALQYGARGQATAGLVRDRILRFDASLTIGELWFVRTEEE